MKVLRDILEDLEILETDAIVCHKLDFAGLLDFHKEKLDGQEFLDVSQVLQKALANESRTKEARNLQNSGEKFNRPVIVLGCESNYSNNEGKDVYATEFAWPSNNKSCTCCSLKPIQKNRQDNIKFNFDVSKCDRIFDELNKLGHIKCLMLFRRLRN